MTGQEHGYPSLAEDKEVEAGKHSEGVPQLVVNNLVLKEMCVNSSNADSDQAHGGELLIP